MDSNLPEFATQERASTFLDRVVQVCALTNFGCVRVAADGSYSVTLAAFVAGVRIVDAVGSQRLEMRDLAEDSPVTEWLKGMIFVRAVLAVPMVSSFAPLEDWIEGVALQFELAEVPWLTSV